MKKTIFILTVSLFAVCAYSQNNTKNEYEEWKPSQNEYTNFDIGKYTTPDIMRNQLDIIFDFNSNNLRDRYSDPDEISKSKSSIIAGDISSSFSHYVNTSKKISYLTGDLSFAGNYSSQEDKQTYSMYDLTIVDNVSNLLQQNSLFLNWSNKWYFSNLVFMDYGISGGILYNFEQDKVKDQSEDRNEKLKNFEAYISPQLGIGFGRIESVRDARHALYIANALSKKGVLTRNLSNDELFELSQKISTVKNKRFLDSRLHLIDEISSVDSFFTDNNLLADNGAVYFTTLYDMWQYGDLFSRSSGYEISFAIRPYFGHQTIKYTPIIRDIINNSNQYAASLNFGYEKPFKLNWQHSLSAEVTGSIISSSNQNKQTDNNYKNSIKYNTASAYASYSLGYYPNTRTNIRVSASQNLSKIIYEGEENAMFSTTTLGANLYYYFSPNLRLAGNYTLLYNFVKDNGGYNSERNNFSSSFTVQLAYTFF